MSFKTILGRGALCLLAASAPLAWARAGQEPDPAAQPGSTSSQSSSTAESQTTQSSTTQSTMNQSTTGTTTGVTAGTMTGRVTAGAGVGVPNASIVVTDVATGQTYRALTGADGSFSIAALPPGTYRVDVETGGFRRMSREDVVLTAGAPMRVDLMLGSGDVRETVEVKAVSPVYQAETAERAIGFGTRTVRQMPIIDRKYQELFGLISGITPPIPTPLLGDPQRNRIINVNGQNSFANNHMLDGLDNNEPFTGVLTTHVMPVENIQQFNVRTANYNAEYGRAGGAVSNVMTRPGTNEYHGSLFAFHTNNILQARNVFNLADVQPQAHNTWNQFGGSFGGPVWRDKTFFFLGYEGQYHRGQTPMFGTVPTAEMLAGNFSGFNGLTLYNPATGTATGTGRTAFLNNQISPSQFNSTAQSLLGLFPSANLTGVENNYIRNSPYRNDGHTGNGRIDHHFSDRTMAWLRYNFTRDYGFQESALGRTLGTGGEQRLTSHNAAATVNHNFTPSLLADVRFGYNRYDMRSNAFAEQTLAGQQAGFIDPTGLTGSGFPSFNIGGYQFGAPAGWPMRGIDNNFNWASNWSWLKGRHQVKFGVDFRRYRVDGWTDLGMGQAGSFGFTPGATAIPGGSIGQNAFAASFASFLVGAPTTSGRLIYNTTPSYRQTQGYGWISDTFQLTSRLSLDLGVRYEVYGAITPRNAGGLSNFNPFTNTLSVAGIGDNGNAAGIDTDWNNIAPRFGFAFRATSGTVIRGGYAISYFPVPMSWSGLNLFPSAFGVQNGFAGTLGTAGNFSTLPNTGAGITVPDTGQVTPGTNQPLVYFPTELKTPYVQSYNFSIQHDFGSGTLFDIAYVGTLGRQLPYTRELNSALPGTGQAGLPLFQQYGRTASTIERGTGINNNYNSLQANLTKRFSHGLAMQVAYTYSKALDYASNALPFLNNIDTRSNYAVADYDRTHMLTFSHIWELPFGAGTAHLNRGIVSQIVGNWQLNGIFRLSSGLPFSVYSDPSFCNCPGNMLTANSSGTPPRLGATDFSPMTLNAADFSVPVGGFGNLGRNALRGPAYHNYDMSLFRSFPLRDQIKLEFRGEAFNLLNTPHWGNPVANLNSSQFGQTVSLAPGTNNRQVNVALRLLF